MSTTPSLHVSNKRKRTNTTESPVAVVKSSSFEVPPAWMSFLRDIPAANTPPPGVLAAFAKYYHSAIAGYSSALKQHHRIVIARDRFAVESDGNSVPAVISNTLKGPTFVFAKDITTEAEELTTGARETYTKALDVMKLAAVDFVRACHDKNVEASQALIDAGSKEVSLSVDLQSYAALIIKDAGYSDGNIWNSYINAVVSAMGAELNGIRFDVAALVRAEREGEEKALQKAALATAAADAEMWDGTQPITDLIREYVESAVSKRLDNEEKPDDKSDKTKKQKKNDPKPTPSSSNAPNASAASSKVTTSKKKDKETSVKGNGKGKEKQGEASAREKGGKSKSKKSKLSESSDSD